MTHDFELKIMKDGILEEITAEMSFTNGKQQEFQYTSVPPVEKVVEGDRFRHFLTKLDEFMKLNGGQLVKLEINLK